MGIKIYKDDVEVADLPAVGRLIASQAEAGSDNTKMMTPLRTVQAIAAAVNFPSTARRGGMGLRGQVRAASSLTPPPAELRYSKTRLGLMLLGRQ